MPQPQVKATVTALPIKAIVDVWAAFVETSFVDGGKRKNCR
jgi:hypothetical protein